MQRKITLFARLAYHLIDFCPLKMRLKSCGSICMQKNSRLCKDDTVLKKQYKQICLNKFINRLPAAIVRQLNLHSICAYSFRLHVVNHNFGIESPSTCLHFLRLLNGLIAVYWPYLGLWFCYKVAIIPRGWCKFKSCNGQNFILVQESCTIF